MTTRPNTAVEPPIWRWRMALLVTVLAYGMSWMGHDVPPQAQMADWLNIDKWFGADIYRIVKAETESWHPGHHRNNVHPFFSGMTYPLVHLARAVTGAELLDVVMNFHRLQAGLLGFAFYGLAAQCVRTAAQALLLSALALSAAGFVFWAGVAETRVPAALTLCVALALHGKLLPNQALRWLGVNLLAFSMLITNWSMALISMAIKLRWRQVLGLAAVTMAIAVPLSLAQKAAFPKSGLFFKGLDKEAGYVQLTRREPAEVVRKVARRAIVWSTSGFVLPGVAHQPAERGNLRIVYDQSLLEAKLSAVVIVGLACWLAMLGIALRSWWRERDFRSTTTLAVLFLASQLLLHLVYGDETFLFVLNSLPAFLVLVGCGFRSAQARPMVVLACVALACGIANNLPLMMQARVGMLG